MADSRLLNLVEWCDLVVRRAARWPAGHLPDGPWESEPDGRRWNDGKTGARCLMIRNRVSGHWCGYVQVEDCHPLHRADVYSNEAAEIRVHGGLTFSGQLAPPFLDAEVLDGFGQKRWWVGFDCAGASDLTPNLAALFHRRPPAYRREALSLFTYRDVEYAEHQVLKLADQLARKRPLEDTDD